jgi:type IV pilus assembly protein PilW
MRPIESTQARRGFSLVELLIASALGTVLLLGMVQLAATTSATSQTQESHALLQERAVFAMHMLAEHVRQAGYRPQPWNADSEIQAITVASADTVSTHGDRLAIQSLSELNCFSVRNPDLDSDGRPLFYRLESTFDLNGSGNLTYRCRYGPGPGAMVEQIRRQGQVPGVDSFQVLYGEDSNADGTVDHWSRAGEWQNQEKILGLRIGLLLRGELPTQSPATSVYSVLDHSFIAPADGKPRRLYQLTAALRGRIP